MPLSRQRLFSRARRSVPEARDFAVGTLTLWEIEERVDDLRLGVSELAANAVAHGVPAGRQFCVRLARDGDLVRLEVRDSGGGLPLVHPPSGDLCSGRGLWLARAVADGFGVIPHRVGKTVWLTFEVASAPPRSRAADTPGVAPVSADVPLA
ncbi:ATP-binding protein [Streptomyces sp. NBC_01497]|uniref:ATP-binding protein n=1 Tax=Streptomyces sp. NBC_01497 TaxID=2903885 RepID=UPI002E373393|nr:ATP-binding protein [Streptomyces sp. NBC_01497]